MCQISTNDSAAFSDAVKLKMLKDAKPGTWYNNWKPYCGTCDSMARMIQHDYGFECLRCKNMIGWNLHRLIDSPLNKGKLK